MESRANYAAIGLFVLVMMMTGLGFVYWLTNASEKAKQSDIRIVFSGPVTGLNTGSAVLFNGIKVGEVRELSLDAQDPKTVVAIISIDRSLPIRTDTQAILSYQGLTGAASLQMEGGSRNAPLLLDTVEPGGIPTIQADISPFQDIIKSAQSVLTNADSAMSAIAEFIDENGPAFNRTVNNVETFSRALSDNSAAISGALESFGALSKSVDAVAEDLAGTVAQAEAILNAIDPTVVTELTANLTRSTERLDRILARAEEVAGGIDPATINAAVQNVADAAAVLEDTLTKADALVGAVKPEDVAAIVADVRQSSTDLGAAARRAEQLFAAVDDTKVASIVDQVEATTRTLADVSGTIGGVVGSARETMDRVGAVVAAVDPGRVTGFVDQVTNAASILQGTLGKADALVDAVKPEDVTAIVADVRQSTTDLTAATRRAEELFAAVDKEKIASIVDQVDSTTRTLAEVSSTVGGVVGSARETMDRVGAVVGAVEPTKVATAVDDLSAFAGALRTAAPQVEGILADVKAASEGLRSFGDTIKARDRDINVMVTDARNLVGQLNGIAARTDGILQKVDAYVTGDGEGLISEATATLASIRSVADTLNTSIGPITANVSQFTDRGLDSFTSLAEDGRRALSRLERVLGGIESNPQQFIFGGDGVPEYSPRRR